MKLYFAGADNSISREILLKSAVGNVLISYYVSKNKELPRNQFENIFLDSGAFTAFTQDKKIDIDNYIEYVKKNKDIISVYANLDVIGDWEATRRNQEYMENNSLSPLATFHVGSPLEELERICEKYNYIALGGLVPLSTKKIKMRNWLNKCWAVIIKSSPKVKVHGFGVNSFDLLKRYPWYSVDATSWLVPARYGQLLTFNNGKIRTHSKRSKDKSLEICDLAKKEYKELLVRQVGEILKIEEYVTRLWKKKGITWD